MEVSGQRLVSNRFPYLPIHVEARGASHDLEAFVDTGFEGDLVIPPELQPRAAPDGGIRLRLADGSMLLAPFFNGTPTLPAIGSYSVAIIVLGDEPMIGLGLVARLGVLLDHGQRVVVEF